MDLTLKTIPLTELTAFHKNPREGNIDAIATSLQINGQYRPIVVNLGTYTGRENEILAGNHTYYAAQQLGWDTIQAVTIDVDEIACNRIVIADNRTADLGAYDNDILTELLENMPTLEGTGWDLDDLNDLKNYLEPLDLDSLDQEYEPDKLLNTTKLVLQLNHDQYHAWAEHAKNYDTNEQALEALLTNDQTTK